MGALELIVEALGGAPEEFREGWKAARVLESSPPARPGPLPAGQGRRYRLASWQDIHRGRELAAARIAEGLLAEDRHAEAAELLKREIGSHLGSGLMGLYLHCLDRLDLDEFMNVLVDVRDVEMETAESAETVALYCEAFLGDREAACLHMKNALLRDPGNAFYAASVGEHLGRLGRFDEALPYHRRAAELGPDDDTCVGGYVKGLVLAGEFPEAERVGRAAHPHARRAPFLAVGEVTHWLGQALALQGKFTEAEEVLRPAAEEVAAVGLVLARILVAAGRYDEALALSDVHAADERYAMTFRVVRLEILTAAGRSEEAARLTVDLEAAWREAEGEA